jgi:hypothetical protein
LLQNKGWKTNPLTAGVRGAIHEYSIDQLKQLKIPKNSIKTLMKNIHQIAIKYLTYLVLNKRKLDNKQTPVPHPNKTDQLIQHQNPPPKRGITPYATSRDTVINIGLTGLYSSQ